MPNLYSRYGTFRKRSGIGGRYLVLKINGHGAILEYKQLQLSIWNGPGSDDIVENVVSTSDLTVMAEDAATGMIVGCALLLSDRAGSYFVKNVKYIFL